MAVIMLTFWLSNILVAVLWALMWVSVRREIAGLKTAVAAQAERLKAVLEPKDEDLPFAEEIDP